MSETTISGEIVKEYLRKFPSYPSRQLAAMITSAVPGVFKDIEHCRSIVRYYRGARGKHLRERMSPENYIPRINLPVSDSKPWQHIELTSNDFPIIGIGDLHAPFHDEDALEMVLERGQEMKAKTVLIMGDLADCYQLSVFLKDPRQRHFADEVLVVREILAEIRKALPKARIIWKKGNHEFRLDSYIMRQAPELYDLDVMSFAGIYHLSEYKVELVDDKQLIRYKNLFFIHGHEYRGSMFSPVNPARTLFLKAKRSAVEWHLHRASEYTDRAINDDITTTWSAGCLCGLHPEYVPLNDWQQGHTETYLEDDGMWFMRNRKIINYRYVE